MQARSQLEPSGVNTVRLMFNGYEKLSTNAGTPLWVDKNDPDAVWKTFYSNVDGQTCSSGSRHNGAQRT